MKLSITLIQIARRLIAKRFVDIMRVLVQTTMNVLATSFVGSVKNTLLKTQTAAENLIPAVKTTQTLRPVALSCTNVILARETVKMTVTVPEF